MLKQYIVDLKGRLAVYVPIKTDPTDVGLAEYMNAYPDKTKLKIMFDREKEGQYLYGTRRVTIQVMRGKPQIKIGGGFMPIDDFIEQHGPKELELLETRDPLNKAPAAANQSAMNETMSVAAGKSMKRLDSKATVKTSATKTPLKKRGN